MPMKNFLPGLGKRPLVAASLGDFDHLIPDARLAAREGASFLEIRADCFPSDVLRPAPLRALMAKVRKAARRPLLLTLRPETEGGRLPRDVSEPDRLALFLAGLSEVQAIDLELSSESLHRRLIPEAHEKGRGVILSHHDFRKTPADVFLKRLVRKAEGLKGDILKVAAKPRRPADVDRLMEFCAGAVFPHKVFIAMGPLGARSRLEGFRWGSALTYGYVRAPMAPGQMPVETLVKAQRYSQK